MPKIQRIEARKPVQIQRKKVAAYARVSVDTDQLMHSLSAQIMVIVTINDNCNRIGDRAFANCKSLWRIYIPASVTSIGDDFLLGSTKATIYCEEGSEAARWAQSHSWPVVIQ